MDTLQKTIKTLPHSPGVYLFKDINDTVIYVGKARDLYKRVHHYFLESSRVLPKTQQLVSHIRSLRVSRVATEFEALLLEAKCIRFYSPKYNSVAKDDKSPIYIHIPKNVPLPTVQVSRKPKSADATGPYYFGPFATKRTAIYILRTLRRSIPFCQQKIQNGHPCFYTHLGLCNPCPSVIAKMPEENQKKMRIKTYTTQIKRLRWILSGQTKKTIQSLQKEMRELSRQQKFEQAGILRDQIQALIAIINNRYDPFLFEEKDMLERAPAEQTQSLLGVLKPFFPMLVSLTRIECYDISTMQGTSSVGSMVVFLDGIPNTDQYRKFKMKGTEKMPDTAMMEEMIRRRFHHAEWDFPTLIVVDGGKAQVACIHTLLQSKKIFVPIIGLSKRFEQIVIQTKDRFHIETIPFSSHGLQLLQHIRDEAHRFAISYHKKLRKRAFAPHIRDLV